MKAIELRIGNWVKGDAGKPYKFELSDFSDWWNDHNSHEFGNHIHPIPLTEEWLLKFGFKKIELNYGVIIQYYHDCTPPSYRNEYSLVFRFGEMNDNKYRMYWYASGPVNSSMHSFPCEYVHQLQNLYFALTGKELIIEI